MPIIKKLLLSGLFRGVTAPSVHAQDMNGRIKKRRWYMHGQGPRDSNIRHGRALITQYCTLVFYFTSHFHCQQVQCVSVVNSPIYRITHHPFYRITHHPFYRIHLLTYTRFVNNFYHWIYAPRQYTDTIREPGSMFSRFMHICRSTF